LASLNFFSEKLFARNRCRPSGMPMIAIIAKISEREIINAKLPMVSVVVNFVMNIQNIYPAIKDDRNCKYRYIAPLPTAGLNNYYHIPGLFVYSTNDDNNNMYDRHFLFDYL
jgi:hypothetical protein